MPKGNVVLEIQSLINDCIRFVPGESRSVKGGSLLQVASWINRALVLTSIVFSIVDFTYVRLEFYSYLFMVIAMVVRNLYLSYKNMRHMFKGLLF